MRRLDEFDILKGIGILLVMLGHTPVVLNLHNVIYSFHLPLFFIVSGYFFKPQAVAAYAYKLFLRLLVPWLFFASLFTALSFAFCLIGSTGFAAAFQKLWHSLNPLDEQCWQLYRTIWFLISLFFALNFYNFLCKYLKNQLLLGGAIVTFHLLGYFFGHSFNIPFFIDTALSVLIFIYIGNMSKNFHVEQKLSKPKWSSLFVVGIIIAFLLQPSISLRENLYPIYMAPLAIVIVAGLFSFCFQISRYNNIIKRFLVICGIESL